MKIRTINNHLVAGMLATLLLLNCGLSYAEEIASEQTLETDQQYAAVNIQTEMPNEKQKQKMSFHFSMFTVNIQHIHTELIPVPKN